MTWLKTLTRLIIVITLWCPSKRMSLFVILILNLGFEASMSLITILLCSLNLACYNIKKKLRKKQIEKMYASSMPYMSMYSKEEKNAHKSAPTKRSMLQVCHQWKEVCYKHTTLGKKYAASMPHAKKNWKWSNRLLHKTDSSSRFKVCLTVRL